MSSKIQSAVTIQIAPESVPTTPSWFAEAAAFVQVLSHTGIRSAISERVRFARRRFGHYDTTDFVVVLIGYAVSGEPTVKSQPFLPPARLRLADVYT